MTAGPQVVLYMKSGIIERYLLPGVMGYAFLIVVLFRHIRLNGDFNRNLNRKGQKESRKLPVGTVVHSKGVLAFLRSYSPAVMLVILSMTAASLFGLRVTRYTAIAFAQEGDHTNGWFKSIQQNSEAKDRFLIILHPVKHLEPAVSLKTYLELEMDRKDLLFATTDLRVRQKGLINELNSERLSGEPIPDLSSLDQLKENFQVILLFLNLKNRF